MFYTPDMQWSRAIERNSEALERVIATLFAMLATVGEAAAPTLPLAMRNAFLRLLRPAESAVRRLIVIAARGLVVKPGPARTMASKPTSRGRGSRPVFRLFDPRKKLVLKHYPVIPRVEPRIHFFNPDPRVAAIFAARQPAKPAKRRDGLINGERLVRRLQALKSALDNLPREARRLARWRLRQKKYRSPLRPGPPPGHRRKPVHEIDEILAECHDLAWDVLKLDSS